MSIVIKNLSKTFEDGNKALDDVSIEFKKGQITGLIGFNGSGKTTTFNILSRFLEKYEGQVSFDGKPLDREILRSISYLSAGAEPKNPDKVMSHLLYVARLHKLKKADVMPKINKMAKALEFEGFLNSPIKKLSKGNQQKIKIISSLLNPNMKYLFLDEPFDGLDPIMVKKAVKLFTVLKDVTILITSHRMEVVQEMCVEFYVLMNGILIDARRTDDKTIRVAVNKELPIAEIKKLKYVVSAKKDNNETIIILDEIKNFKELNKKVLAMQKFEYIGIKEKNIASSVFEGYQ